MSKTIVLLIYIITFSKSIFPLVSSVIIYEQIRESIDKLNNVTKVRTTAELQAKGNELALLDFIGLVQQYEGYKAEEYDVQTEDGYILKMHRIISSPHSPKTSNKPVVLLQHGIFCTSEFFVLYGPSHDLGFMLADAGYDVWLGNARGTPYSKHHVKYSSASTNYDFWNFNIDDLGLKDTPAMIDAALEKTNKTKLTYIGHSLGATMNFILLSSKPEYNDKIDLSINLSPVSYFVKPYSLFFRGWLLLRTLIPLGHALQVYEILPLSKLYVIFAKTVCTNFIGRYLCALLIRPLLSYHDINFNKLPAFYSLRFNGVSLDILTHFGQLASQEKFRKFDYGSLRNQEKYNSSEPPDYDLSRISSPQAIFYAEQDIFISPKAVKKVKMHLKNVVSFEKVPESYRHLDFLLAANAKAEYYYKLLNLVKKFSK